MDPSSGVYVGLKKLYAAGVAFEVDNGCNVLSKDNNENWDSSRFAIGLWSFQVSCSWGLRRLLGDSWS